MYRKGSITVYVSLMLTVLLTILAAALYSVQSAGTRVQAAHAANQGMYSLLGRYDRTMLERYHLFFLDSTFGEGQMNPGGIYRLLEQDTASIADGKQKMANGLALKNGSITGYTLATDNDGNAVKSQAVAYMESVMGVQGVQNLMDKLKGEEEIVHVIEEEVEQIDEEEAMQVYDELAGESWLPTGIFQPEDRETDSYENPVEAVKGVQHQGILPLTLPQGKAVSDAYQMHSSMVSGRKLEMGMGMPFYDGNCDSWDKELLFHEYLLRHLGCFTEAEPSEGLIYQLEYVIQGHESDMDNLKGAINKILLLRESSNLIYLWKDEAKRAQAKTAALILASVFAVPEAAKALEPVILICWAFAESVLDVRELLDGGKVPLQKSDDSWQMSLSSLPKIVRGFDALRKSSETGMNYQEYLRVLLLMVKPDEKLERTMDMIETGMRAEEGREEFRLDGCIYGLEAAFTFETDQGQEYEAVRRISYGLE